MAVTRIKNNQITDSTITYQKIASGTLVGSLFNSNLALNSNVTITGNLTVSGNTTTVNSIDTTVNDPLIVFNSGYVGTPSYDVGFLVDRSLGSLGNYGGVNAALIWSESDGAFITVLTTETGATKGAVSKNFRANLITGNLTVANAITGGTANFASINNTLVGNVTPAGGWFTTLFASTGFSTGNAVIAGGYISSLTNAYITTSRITNFSTANAIISGGNITIATGANTSYVVADNVEGLNTNFGNLTAFNGRVVTFDVTNFSTGNAVIAGGYISALTNATMATTNIGTGTVVTLNASAANIAGSLYAAGLNTANAVISGGYISSLTNAYITTSQITNFSTANAVITGGYVTGLSNISVTGVTTSLGNLVAAAATASNSTSTGGLVVIGGAGIAGNLNVGENVYITGNLVVQGNTTTLNVDTLDVEDKNITIAKGAVNSAAANGAGLTVDGANATLLYTSTGDSWNFNKQVIAPTLNVTANVYLKPQSGGATIAIDPLVIGTIDNMSIGSSTAANAYVSNFRATTSLFAAPTGTVWLRGGTGTSGINNIPIGAVTPAAGTFTTAESQTLNVTNGNVVTLVATNFSSGNIVATGVTLLQGNLVANATTASTDTTTGALVVRGGAGIGGAAIIGGNVVAASGTSSTNTTTGALIVTGGAGVSGAIYAGSIQNTPIGSTTVSTGAFSTLTSTGTTIASGNIVAASATASTNTTTGALVVVGGVGIGGNLNISGNINSPGNIVVNSTKSAATDFVVRGANENSLIYAISDTTYDQVVIGGNLTTANVTQGAKLQVNSTDALIVPVGSSAERPSGKGYTDVDGMIRFNNTNNVLEYYGDNQWNNAGTSFTVITSRTFANVSGDLNGNVDGTNTVFTLTANGTSAGTLVTINGVMQIPITAYSITGTTLTFTEAPAVGDVVDTRILATTSVVTQLASPNGFNQFVANNTSLSLYTGNVSLGSIENWRLDTNGDFYPVTRSNVGAPGYRVDYLFASNIDIQGGAISGVSLGGGSLDNTVIGGNIASTGTFTTLYASTLLQTNAAIASDDLTGLFVAPGATNKISSFDKSVYRSGKFFVQLSDESGTEYQAAEVLVVHNGTTPSIEVYGVTFTGAANLATFSSNIAGSVVNLNASSAGANLTAKVTPTLMRI